MKSSQRSALLVATLIGVASSSSARAQIFGQCNTLATNTSPSVAAVAVNTAADCYDFFNASWGYRTGDAISITAPAVAGYTFSGWSGTGGTFADVNAATTTFTISSAGGITASYTALPCEPLTAATNPNVAVVSVNTAQNCAGGYNAGTAVSITAPAVVGYNFVGWTGAGGTFADPTAASTVFTISDVASITANYAADSTCYVLTTATNPNVGSIAVNTAENCTQGFYVGTAVSVSAPPVDGYNFTGWTGTGGIFSDATAATTIFTLAGNPSGIASLTANYTPCYALTTSTSPAVASVSVGTAANCSGGYTPGTVIAISAPNVATYIFSGWSGTGGTFADPTATGAATTFTLSGTASITANYTSSCYSFFTLSQGQSLQIGTLSLVMQSDGNLVLYRGGTALWSSGTAGQNCGTNQCNAQFQSDGNLVVYNGSTAIWASGTNGQGATTLCLSSTAPYLEITDANQDTLWASSYCFASPFSLKQGQFVQSGTVKFVMQSDGNLVLYQGANAVWSSNTWGQNCGANQCTAQFQSDGNFVVYNGSTPLWASGTAGQGGTTLCLIGAYVKMTDAQQHILWATALNGPLQSNSYADKYARNFPYGYNTGQNYTLFQEVAVYPPVRSSTCWPQIPVWSNWNDRYVTAFLNSPWVGNWKSGGVDGATQQRYFVWPQPGVYRTIYYVDHIETIDWIARPTRNGVYYHLCPLDRAPNQYDIGTNGVGSQRVYAGELLPNGWGILPIDADAVSNLHWQVMTPPRRHVYNDAALYNSVTGDGRIVSTAPIRPILGPPLFGGGEGPECYTADCTMVGSRSRLDIEVNAIGGIFNKYVYTISGYGTAENVFANTGDVLADLANFGGIPLQLANPNVYAVAQSIEGLLRNGVDMAQIEIQGHSLGALDALVLYQYGYGGMATLFALPFVAPPSMTVPWGNRSLLIYVGLYDVIPRTHNVNCPQYTYADQCWVSYGANVILVDTGGGFVSGYQPHDRCRYQTVVWGGCRW